MHPTEINILMAGAVVTPAPTRRTPGNSVDRGSTTCHVYESRRNCVLIPFSFEEISKRVLYLVLSYLLLLDFEYNLKILF